MFPWLVSTHVKIIVDSNKTTGHYCYTATGYDLVGALEPNVEVIFITVVHVCEWCGESTKQSSHKLHFDGHT